MTHKEKFEELKKEYNIDETCEVVINEGDNQVVYEIEDEEGNYIMFDFLLEDKSFRTIIDPVDSKLYEEEIRFY